MKRAFLFSILTVLTLLLSACGSDDTTATQKEESQKTEVKTENEAEAEKKEEKEVVEEVEATDDGLKEAFENYLLEVGPILVEHAALAEVYEVLRTSSANYEITDEEFAEILYSEILPVGTSIQDELESIIPDKEFRDLHEKFIKMIAKGLQGMTELVAAVETGDTSKITSANTLLAEARELDRDALYDMQDLADKYGVELE
ncbi:hypothetical protein [Bacillus sp. SM2101]|uniref:hypothetical protein n=1 Tax=Bacillus sp. SM2101 TaxID=2805366 RepID=UPI001BDF1AEB|nr:hypothetical protein [Bacillus sp. SM2101]